MSVIAISIATEKTLDIVTSSGQIHRALVEQDEDAAFRRLIDGPGGRPRSGERDALRNELGMAVLLTAFDVRKLSVPQICELVKEGKDLGRFKTRLDQEVRDVRFIPDPQEREARIREAAADIIDEWKKHQKTLPKYALEALKHLAEAKVPEALTALVTGATRMVTLASGVGLTIAFAACKGATAWNEFQEKQKHPLNYLSRIQKTYAGIARRV